MQTKTTARYNMNPYYGPPRPPSTRKEIPTSTVLFFQCALTGMAIDFHCISTSSDKETKQHHRVLCRRRMDWGHHVNLLLLEGQFKRYFQMSPSSFEKILCWLAPSLKTDATKSMCRTGIRPLTPPGIFQLALCWLAGGNYNQIRAAAGISISYFFAMLWKVLGLIISHSSLQISFPTDQNAIRALVQGYRQASTNQVINGCVGAIDGWL